MFDPRQWARILSLGNRTADRLVPAECLLRAVVVVGYFVGQRQLRGRNGRTLNAISTLLQSEANT